MKKHIAITGGIGSGKSAVLTLLQEMGYPAFSCDEIYLEVIQLPEYIEKIKKVFPKCIINNQIDRKILGRIIFQEEEKRNILNTIAHPLIMRRLKEKMEASKNTLTFAEVPLLFEGNFENQFDGVIVILRSKKERIQALRLRDGSSEEHILQQFVSQFNYEGKDAELRFKNCNAFLIKNDGSLSELKMKVLDTLKNLVK